MKVKPLKISIWIASRLVAAVFASLLGVFTGPIGFISSCLKSRHPDEGVAELIIGSMILTPILAIFGVIRGVYSGLRYGLTEQGLLGNAYDDESFAIAMAREKQWRHGASEYDGSDVSAYAVMNWQLNEDSRLICPDRERRKKACGDIIINANTLSKAATKGKYLPDDVIENIMQYASSPGLFETFAKPGQATPTTPKDKAGYDNQIAALVEHGLASTIDIRAKH